MVEVLKKFFLFYFRDLFALIVTTKCLKLRLYFVEANFLYLLLNHSNLYMSPSVHVFWIPIQFRQESCFKTNDERRISTIIPGQEEKICELNFLFMSRFFGGLPFWYGTIASFFKEAEHVTWLMKTSWCSKRIDQLISSHFKSSTFCGRKTIESNKKSVHLNTLPSATKETV